MFSLSPGGGRRKPTYTATGPDAYRGLAFFEGITGVSFTSGTLRVPAEPRIFEMLQDICGLEPDEEAKLWYAQTVVPEWKVAKIMGKSSVLVHPKAEVLREYQRAGVLFLNTVKRGILGDEPGTGKTAQAIVAVDMSRFHDKMLIVCPNSVKYQWQAEIDKWSCLGVPVTVVTPKTAKKDIETFTGGWLILNYHNMRAYKEALKKIYFDWVIPDEAHALVNRKTQAFDVVSHLHARRMALLTGSPIGNSPDDLWALLNLIDPVAFPSFWRFFALYVRYTEDYFGGRTILGAKNELYLRRELAPRMLRRMKVDVAPELPEKVRVTLPIEMTPKQEKLYRDLAKTLSAEDDEGNSISVLAVIALITRLRQMCSTPAAFGMEDTSAKLSAVEEIITGTDEKIVVFSLYLKTVDCICTRLTNLNVSWARLTGKENAEERVVSQQKLNSGEARVLVCTIGAGGTGLNLQAASVVIFVEQHWNPREQVQAENRVHRIGQKKSVTIYTLLCRESIDTAVQRVLDRKQAMSDAVLREALTEELCRYRKDR